MIGTEAMMKACSQLLERMGVGQMRIGFTPEEDGEPIVWYCTAFFRTAGAWEAAGAMSPDRAMFRLCERACDGGTCMHCKRPTGIVDDAQASEMPLNKMVCWYAYDPELQKFRRSCEGAT